MARPSKNAVWIEPDAEGPGDLCGVKEAATICQVERTRIARWQKLEMMPPPLAKLASGPVWLRRDIDQLAKRRAEKRARPIPA